MMQRRRSGAAAGSLILIALLLAGRPASAVVSPLTLSDAVILADAAAVARVVETRAIDARWREADAEEPVPVVLARARVEQWLGGGPPREELWFLASPTWTCDTTRAVRGERCVLLLSAVEPSTLFDEESVRQLGEVLRDGPLHQVLHAGRGRLPIHEAGGAAYVEVWASDLLLPRGMELLPGQEPWHLAVDRGWVRLADLLVHLKHLLGPGPPLPDPLRRMDAELIAAVRSRWRDEASGERSEPDLAAARRRQDAWTLAQDPAYPRREPALWLWMSCLGPDVVDDVLNRLEASNVRGRRAAALALDLGQRASGIELTIAQRQRVEALARAEADPEALMHLIHALARSLRMDLPEHIETLRFALEHPRSDVRFTALEALAEAWFVSPFAEPGAERDRMPEWLEARTLQIAEGATGRERRAAWRLLVRRASEAARPAAERALDAADPFVSTLAAMVIADRR